MHLEVGVRYNGRFGQLWVGGDIVQSGLGIYPDPYQE